MKRTFIFFLALCCTACLQLHSIIIQAYDLDEIIIHFENLDHNSLVMWDVDDTLISPGDEILHLNAEQHRNELMHRYVQGKTADEFMWLVSQIWLKTPFKLIDTRSVSIIADLQQRGIPVMALTALETKTKGAIPSMELWRYNQLMALGIHFKHFLPHQPHIEWIQEPPEGGNPVFFHGILCTDTRAKGPVLASFLEQIEWKPKIVLLIDDNIFQLRSVEKSLKEMGIPFIGFHYRIVEMQTPSVNMELAHLQFITLVNQGQWIPDQDAQALLPQAKL